MPTFAVRHVIQWSPERPDQKAHLYEERITAWNAESMEEALALAEQEARNYADDGAASLDLYQGYWLSDDVECPSSGVEVFSLLRESDLAPEDYIDRFFDTGDERQGELGAAG